MRTSTRLAGAAATTGVLLVALAAGGATFQPPPAPTRWVTDTVGLLPEPTRRALDARLERYERDTGRQVVVWIGGSLGEVPLEEWAARTFEAWGIGRRGKDDGAALFVFAQERRLRIEVGYGLEGEVPDVVAHRIIQEEGVPRLRAGDPGGAVSAMVGALLGRLGGETSPPPREALPPGVARRAPQQQPSPAQGLLCTVLGVVAVFLLVTNPRLALFFLFSMMSGGGGRHRGGGGWGGGGFGGGGGGFGGGGGRSGGGGASGSW